MNRQHQSPINAINEVIKPFSQNYSKINFPQRAFFVCILALTVLAHQQVSLGLRSRITPRQASYGFLQTLDRYTLLLHNNKSEAFLHTVFLTQQLRQNNTTILTNLNGHAKPKIEWDLSDKKLDQKSIDYLKTNTNGLNFLSFPMTIIKCTKNSVILLNNS